MKFRFLLACIAAAFFIVSLAVVTYAQDTDVPDPYTGLTNPFPWDDTSAQQAGKGIYQASCIGCHGADGSNMAAADFSVANFAPNLEAKPDFYFWILSDGRLDKGMPPYKSSLSEGQRWQVLTYLRSIGNTGAPPETTSPPGTPALISEDSTLFITVPEQARTGQPLILGATLRDNQDRPVGGAVVKFFLKVDLFTSGLMEVGESITNDQGVASFEYTPRQTGETTVVARYETIEAAVKINLTGDGSALYHPEIGIKVPVFDRERFIGPESLKLGEGGTAPPSVFRLPSGSLFWLAPLLWTVMAIWVVYLYVMYQVSRIPIAGEIKEINTRRLPLIGIGIIMFVGTVLVIMLVTSPISNPPVG